MNFALVAAVEKNSGIGFQNRLPWNLPSDLKHFSNITTKTIDPNKQNAVIMGRKTWESLPEKHRPLKNRLNIVLSRRADFALPAGVQLFDSIDSALQNLSTNPQIDSVFLIGGAALFTEAIHHPACTKIFLTQIEQSFECDTFFPKIDPQKFKLATESVIQTENGVEFRFLNFQKPI